MVHFKNLKKNSTLSGFSFMEVMIAILMLGMMMTAILSLQNTTFRSIVNFSSRLKHIFSLNNIFITNALQKAEQKEEIAQPTQEQPQEILYALEKISEQSELKKFENVMIQKSQAQWQEGAVKRQETMISFLYKAPEKKENEQK